MFIILWSVSRKSTVGITGQSQDAAGLRDFLAALRKSPLPCLFHLLEAAPIPWLMAHFHLPAQQWHVFLAVLPLPHLWCWPQSEKVLLLRPQKFKVGPPGHSPHLKVFNLNHACKVPFPCKVTHSHSFQELGYGPPWGSVFLTTTGNTLWVKQREQRNVTV